MFSVFKVNGRDLTTYIRGQHDEGLDLSDPDHSEPQFAGSLGLGDGQAWIRDSASNKEMQVPLLLDAASTDALHKLVRDIKIDLFNGAQVEIKLDQASDSTFFTLETGQLSPEYQFFLHQNNWLRAMLRLWTRPFGHTATQRMIASTRTSGVQAAVAVVAATGVIGDRDAFMGLRVRVGSQVASSGRFIAYGVSRFNTPDKDIVTADLAGHAPAASSVAVGASGALASQYLAIPVGATIATGIAQKMYVAPAPVGGRSRVFAILRSGLYPADAMRLYARDRFGAILGPTALATQIDQNKWQVVDLGELNHPAQPSGLEGVPSQEVQIIAGGAPGASVVASPALHLSGLVYLPLEVSAGVLWTAGAGGGQLYADSFERFVDARTLLETKPAADGANWSRIGGYFSNGDGPLAGQRMAAVGPTGIQVTGATAIYALASGARNTDVTAEALIGILAFQPSAGASGLVYELWPKGQAANEAATVGVRAKLVVGPSANHHLALISHDGTATALHASVGLGGSTASALHRGQAMRLVTRIVGNLADVYLATGPLPASPLISVTHANIGIAGHPIYALQAGVQTNGLGPVAYMDNVGVSRAGGSAPDTAAREWFKFESYPQGRAIRGATTFEQDMMADFRGNFPRMPAMGSPAPSGAAYIVVMQGSVDNFVGNDVTDIEAYVTSNFDFMR